MLVCCYSPNAAKKADRTQQHPDKTCHMKTLLITLALLATTVWATEYTTTVTNIQPQPGNRNPATAGCKVDRAYVYGFTLSLDDPNLETSPAFGQAPTVQLNRLSLMNRRAHNETKNVSSMKIAIYTKDNHFVALSKEATDSRTPNKINTLTFQGATLQRHEPYKYLFVDAKTSEASLKAQTGKLPKTVRTGIELYCVPQATSIYSATKLNPDLSADSSSLHKRIKGFMPIVTLSTTDQHPNELTMRSPVTLLLLGAGLLGFFLWSTALIAYIRRKA